jgi:N-acyl-L-homoserine lactone synthetase
MIQEAALSDHAGPESSFSNRIALLQARIDCRAATTGEQREAIFRLRYEAGMRERPIAQRSSLTFSDRYDNTGNVYLLGLYIDDELASSIRLHIASKEQPQFPSLDVFADALQSELDVGRVIIDGTRFVADEHLSQLNRELPYATLRFCMLAAEHFHADYLITAASPPHDAFYRRAFNYRPTSERRLHPDLATPVRLMTLNYPTAADDLYRRYPFFRSTPAERWKLFGNSKLAQGAS